MMHAAGFWLVEGLHAAAFCHAVPLLHPLYGMPQQAQPFVMPLPALKPGLALPTAGRQWPISRARRARLPLRNSVQHTAVQTAGSERSASPNAAWAAHISVLGQPWA